MQEANELDTSEAIGSLLGLVIVTAGWIVLCLALAQGGGSLADALTPAPFGFLYQARGLLRFVVYLVLIAGLPFAPRLGLRWGVRCVRRLRGGPPLSRSRDG